MLIAGSLPAVEVTAEFPGIMYNGTLLPKPSFGDPRDAALQEAISGTEEALRKFDSMNNLARGFSNANSYASDAATTRGLMGYKFLTIAVGTMASLQMPGRFVNTFNDSLSSIAKEGDLYFGAGFHALTLSVGVNAGFLADGLYLTGKIGKFSSDIEDLKYDSFVFGLLASYQLVDPFSIGILKWRGLQAGSGIVYYESVSITTFEVESVSAPVEFDPDGAGPSGLIETTLYLDPTVTAKIKSSGFKIPFELITGIRVFWIANLSFGLGVDMNFAGKSEIALKADGETSLGEELSAIEGVTVTPGNINVKSSTKSNGADFLRFRAMAGIGFGLGPLKIDIPVSYYFDGSGFGTNLGITGALTL